MKLLITNAQIFDPASKFHSKLQDVLIEDGRIAKVGKNLSAKQKLDIGGKLICPGFVDLFAHFNEPGFEQKEDIQSGIASALFSGFTDVCVIPNTDPVLETKSDINFVTSRSAKGVTLHPIAAVSLATEGENLTEILDLHHAGAIAFSDGVKPIWNSELLLKTLQYVARFGGLVITRPKDHHLSQFAQMHEGPVSTVLGMKGEPALSEEIAIKRDLDILRYAGGKIHFTQISTAGAVELVKGAKKEGLQVTCDVAIHQLMYTDQQLMTFDTNLKVDPPFRLERDRRALISGVKSGVIDAIVSGHQPQDMESKELEFDLSEFGICSLPTVYSNLLKLDVELPLELSVPRITSSPRKILGLDEVSIAEGFPARLAIFDPEVNWVFDAVTNPSKSSNSPQLGEELTGRCRGVINGEVVNMFEKSTLRV